MADEASQTDADLQKSSIVDFNGVGIRNRAYRCNWGSSMFFCCKHEHGQHKRRRDEHLDEYALSEVCMLGQHRAVPKTSEEDLRVTGEYSLGQQRAGSQTEHDRCSRDTPHELSDTVEDEAQRPNDAVQ